MSTNDTTPIETCITLCNTDIKLCQRHAAHPAMMWGNMHYRHTIEIIIVGEWRETFQYCGSMNDYQKGIDMLSETYLITAFECAIGDAIAGTYDCKEFFAEFGYEDPCEGIKAWKACIKTADMLNRMGISEDMLYDLSNELSEME